MVICALTYYPAASNKSQNHKSDGYSDTEISIISPTNRIIKTEEITVTFLKKIRWNLTKILMKPLAKLERKERDRRFKARLQRLEKE
jgi:hypothetical protein